ncbi:carbohydrate-responsive element-binding protein-like [Centruroides sculpturatus]|uniref:carbohydrate-responsive element-binding protein-like n=1 Tax=Centruroides sculpturatus TaxID=218467 RepID=UPI000C6D1887|nr:carbohydrate-responsive element-binding protein-like [Centruroides sculpturatus]
MIGNVNNIHSQTVVQEMNPLSLDVTTRQSALQNSSLVSSDNITSMSRTLRTERNDSSLTSFKTLNVLLNSEKHGIDQPVSDFNCAMNIASQSTKQSSFHVTGQLQSHLPSQVPMALSSQARTAQQERFINSRSSKNPPQISPSSIQYNSGNINLTYQTPVHTANAIPSQIPLTTQSHINLSAVNSSTMTAVKSESTLRKMNSTGGLVISSKPDTNELSNELAQIRRHSYTGLSVDEILSRKNMLQNRTNLSNLTNIPKMASGEKFVIPETPIKQRVRSRSVSSPQAGTLSTNSLQPSSSVSLNNVSTSPPPISQQTQTGESLSFASKNSFVSNTISNRNISGILPQNAVLAQLLMSGTTIAPRLDRPLSFTNVTTTTTTTTTLSSTVTIINSIPPLAATTPTFVLSPVAIATVASVPTLQRNLFVDTATNQIVGCQTSTQDGIPASISPALLNSSIDGSGSPNKPFRPKSDEERVQYKEHRRVCHINAEQKRRCNIKNGFESLRHLLPSLSQNPNAKVSKAAMLQKAAEYIRALKVERQQQQEEAELLRQKRDSLNESISLYQKQLPATGAPIPCQKTNRMRELFDDYVRTQTLQNWKFWIFSLLMEPLLEAYNDTVSTGSINELCESVLEWVNQHCSLITLRPGVLNSLRNLGTTTNILTDPTRLPEEATRAVAKKETNLH